MNMVGNRLTHNSIPRIAGLTPEQELKRETTFRKIQKKLSRRDFTITELDLEGIRKNETTLSARKERFASSIERRKSILSEDRNNSAELFLYLDDAVANLKKPVIERNSSNLADVYNEFVQGVAALFDEHLLSRSFSENTEMFLQVEPHMTSCSIICDVSPLGEKVRGILAASFTSNALLREKYSDDFCEFYGPMLEEAERLRESEERIHKGARIIPFPGPRPGERNEFKSGAEKEDMAYIKKKSLFPAIATQEGGGWAAVMFLEDDLSKPVSREYKEGIQKAKDLVNGSDLSDEEKKPFLEYLQKAEKGDMFAVTQAVAVVYWYFQGKTQYEQFEFEVRLMDAWLAGEIDGFLKKENKALNKIIMPAEEKTKLNEMFELATTRSQIMKGVAAGNLRFYYPLAKPEERLRKISNMAYLLSCAKPVEELAL